MSLRTKIASAGFLALLPVLTFAQSFDGSGYLSGTSGIAETFSKIVKTLLPAMIGLVIIAFAYGLFVYLKGGAEDKEKGKSIMIWGSLAVIILLSIYGIAGLFQKVTGLQVNDNTFAPNAVQGL